MHLARTVLLGSAAVLIASVNVAHAGRGGYSGGARGGMGRGPGVYNSMSGMPPGMSGGGGRGMGMGNRSSMSGMPPGMNSRGTSGGMGNRSSMSGASGDMRPGMSNRVPGEGNPGMNGPALGRAGTGTSAGTGWGSHPYATGAGWGNPYGAYHSDWYHGGWNGNYGRWGGYGYGVPAGMGSWAYGPMLSNMGYSSYANPYYGMGGGGLGTQGVAQGAVNQPNAPGAAGQATAYNYAQPIDTTAKPPAPAVTDAAEDTFDQSRAAFMSGDYAQALSLDDKALQQLPNDAAIHEFRGLILFALKRYDEAAATLYAVLSAGPGWDWTTMMSLYPDADTYTAQFRALEEYGRTNSQSAAAHFVLAYHYLAQGHNDAAVDQFHRVLKLQPNDTLSAKLVQVLSGVDKPSAPTEPAPDAAQATSYAIDGTWTASPTKDVGITLTVQKNGAFTWQVANQGKPRELDGKSTFGNNLLTLDSSQGPPLVGKVTWQDENHFTFQAAGGGAADPGLSFGR